MDDDVAGELTRAFGPRLERTFGVEADIPPDMKLCLERLRLAEARARSHADDAGR
jgi:hypothetical protein